MGPASAHELTAAGLRVTPQRMAVLEYLRSTHAHPTADQVRLAVNERMRSVSRASVYNVLHTLCAAGLVREVVAGDAVSRYDANRVLHDHFLCRACGKLEDIATTEAPPATPAGPARVIESAEILYRGLCPACAGR